MKVNKMKPRGILYSKRPYCESISYQLHFEHNIIDTFAVLDNFQPKIAINYILLRNLAAVNGMPW
jgi:hypothetical protein